MAGSIVLLSGVLWCGCTILCSSMDGTVHCFQFGAIRNNISVNIHVEVFVWAGIFIFLC